MTGFERKPPLPVEELGEARWDRLERRLFEARDRELAAAGGDEGRVGTRRRAQPRWMPFAVVGAAVAAAVAVQLVMRPRVSPGGGGEAAKVTRIVTPAGGETRLELGDAVVLVGGETSAEIRQGAAGAITVALAKGGVDCEVAPRGGRPPFVVLAGDVAVTVVGTKFKVERQADVKVIVSRGKVSVRSPSGERQVAAGETWASSGSVVATAVPAPQPQQPQPAGAGPAATAAPAAAAPPTAAAEPTAPAAPAATSAPAPAPAPAPVSSEAEAKLYKEADELEKAEDYEGAMRIYRRLVRARTKNIAAKSLHSLGWIEYKLQHYDASIRWEEECLRRFKDVAAFSDLVQEVHYVRILGYYEVDYPRAREVAKEYLEQFPGGKYAEKSRQIAYWQ